MGQAIVSCRHDDHREFIRRLAGRLKDLLGTRDIFHHVASILLGVDFGECTRIVYKSASHCGILIYPALIGLVRR